MQETARAESSGREPRIASADAASGPLPEAPLRVALVISNLEYGGAQRQVVELANQLNARGHAAHVISLSPYVPLADGLNCRTDAESPAAGGLHVVAKRGRFDAGIVTRLARLLARLAADVVHTFLFDAEIAGRLAGRLYGRAAVIGSERNTDYHLKFRHAAALRATGRWFDAIIANSAAGRRFQMRRLGLAEERVFVVHNGIDVDRFRPGDGAEGRRELDLPLHAPVIGLFSSFKEQKNHAMFFRAARRVLAARPDARFVCVGDALHGGLQDSGAYRDRMRGLAAVEGLNGAVTFAGNRMDVVPVYRACSITALTSRREGTPNVLLESMACGVPVVATDVADNAYIVPQGRGGHVVPLDDDAAMADRMLELIADERRRNAMGAAAREWVVAEFSAGRMAEKTVSVYREVLRRRAR